MMMLLLPLSRELTVALDPILILPLAGRRIQEEGLEPWLSESDTREMWSSPSKALSQPFQMMKNQVGDIDDSDKVNFFA